MRKIFLIFFEEQHTKRSNFFFLRSVQKLKNIDGKKTWLEDFEKFSFFLTKKYFSDFSY